MEPRLASIKRLVSDSTYPIDEAVIAEAIVVRLTARWMIPDLSFRHHPPPPEVRSFRPHRGARSFRLERAQRRGASGGVTAGPSSAGATLR